MVIYEVNLEVDPSVIKAFREWLPGHIEEVLQCRGFEKAECCIMESANPSKMKALWTVLYYLKSKECLEEYFALHAPRLREDGMKRFGGKFTATRRVLEVSHEFFRQSQI